MTLSISNAAAKFLRHWRREETIELAKSERVRKASRSFSAWKIVDGGWCNAVTSEKNEENVKTCVELPSFSTGEQSASSVSFNELVEQSFQFPRFVNAVHKRSIAPFRVPSLYEKYEKTRQHGRVFRCFGNESAVRKL